jgi:hypothetical protein
LMRRERKPAAHVERRGRVVQAKGQYAHAAILESARLFNILVRMGPLDAIWHALNFFAPALGLAVLAASAAKLLWRHDLAGVSWLRLALWAALAGMAALIGGLVVFGRDGKMATYAALVVVAAVALWVAGFVRR